jgi:hypothetical protein
MRTLTFAVAAIGAVLLGGSKQASADILLTVAAGTSTTNFDFASNTSGSTPASGFTIDGYNLVIHTVVTNFPGSPAIGSITTTVNVGSTTGTPLPLTTTVQLVSSQNSANPFASPLLPWTGGPSTPTVTVNSGASFTGNNTTTTGSTTTTTYFNSPPATTFATSTAGPVGNQPTPTGASTVGSATLANPTGTYTLSQVLTLTGLNAGAAAFNFGATSTVSPVAAVPEPSTMALAGLGALGLIGYGLRRRKATGA